MIFRVAARAKSYCPSCDRFPAGADKDTIRRKLGGTVRLRLHDMTRFGSSTNRGRVSDVFH